jgi:hypothetical protein
MSHHALNDPLSRRSAGLTLFGFLLGLKITPGLAQEVCSSDGPSGDDILKAMLNPGSSSSTIRTFAIQVIRSRKAVFAHKYPDGSEKEEVGVIGDFGLNNASIGQSIENDALKIPAGKYVGYIRYVSKKNFVQGPFGVMSTVGDFLVEVGNVPGRTGILLHGGNKPWHTTGCILLGAVHKDSDKAWVEPSDTLFKLRKEFYGTDQPVACPNVGITIEITDNV